MYVSMYRIMAAQPAGVVGVMVSSSARQSESASPSFVGKVGYVLAAK
jgi:hypothetical protein